METKNSDALFEQWQAAEQAAVRAESVVENALSNFTAGLGPPPTSEMAVLAKELRDVAQGEWSALLAAMNTQLLSAQQKKE